MTDSKKDNSPGILSNVPEENRFWCCDGRVLSNLHDLQKAMKEMREETFRYHVNKEKNDFYNWINYVVNDENLAEKIKRIRTQKGAERKINARIRELKKTNTRFNVQKNKKRGNIWNQIMGMRR